ncbi:MAG: formylglycine-generating enzyme family protein [Kiritimatiellae bacterium]|nr:formylglycine-generating enzyme family protein [Kiritimatiellia bacterium]
MNFRMTLVGIVCGLVMGSAFAAPVISDIQMEQDPATRAVTVNYTLTGGPAVVTAGVTTNGVPVSDAYISRTYGDIHQVIRTDGPHTFTWLPDRNAAQDEAFRVDSGAQVTVTAWLTNDPPPVMAVDLSMTNRVLYFASVDALPEGGLKGKRCKTSLLVLKRIPAGGREFVMGRNKNTYFNAENESKDNESPHVVSLQSDFYLGVFELTQYQWDLIAGGIVNASANATNTAYWATRPMENISWYDLHESNNNTYNMDFRYPNPPASNSFLGLIRARTGVAFELPGEAEWEFAATTGLPSDDPSMSANSIIAHGRTWDNWLDPQGRSTDLSTLRNATTEQGTAEVGSYEPNFFGLYDVNGNVWEWTLDWYLEDRRNLNGEICMDRSTGQIVVRSGSTCNPPVECRAQRRFHRAPGQRTANTGARIKAPVTAH